jgi:hypothetical protein
MPTEEPSAGGLEEDGQAGKPAKKRLKQNASCSRIDVGKQSISGHAQFLNAAQTRD